MAQLQVTMDETPLKAPETYDHEDTHTNLDALKNSKAILRNIARQQAASPKDKGALSTPEILEMILLELNPREVLINCLLVCKSWKEIIFDSPPLQQELHFQPMPPEKQHFQDGKPMYSLCGLLTHIINAGGPESWDNFQIPSILDFDPNTLLGYVVQLSKLNCTEALSRPEASWRKMLMVQPPVLFTHYFYSLRSDFVLVQKKSSQREDLVKSVNRYDGTARLGKVYDVWVKMDWVVGIVKEARWWTAQEDLWTVDTNFRLVHPSRTFDTKNENDLELELSLDSWKDN